MLRSPRIERGSGLHRLRPLDLRRQAGNRLQSALDFDDRAADTAVRFNGFYLFQTVDRRYIA